MTNDTNGANSVFSTLIVHRKSKNGITGTHQDTHGAHVTNPDTASANL